jgi:hypothetical protein
MNTDRMTKRELGFAGVVRMTDTDTRKGEGCVFLIWVHLCSSVVSLLFLGRTPR